MAMAFAILSSLGQIENLDKAIDRGRIDLGDIDKSGSDFLEKLSGLLEKENMAINDMSKIEEGNHLEISDQLKLIEGILQEKDLDQSKEAALLVLLNQLGILDFEGVNDLDPNDIQYESLMSMLDNLEGISMEELAEELEADLINEIGGQEGLEELLGQLDGQEDLEELLGQLDEIMEASDYNSELLINLLENNGELDITEISGSEILKQLDHLLGVDLKDLDLSGLDNEFLKLIQEFAEENQIEFKLADLENQEKFTSKLLEILTSDDGEDLLSNIKNKYTAEVRAMELFVDSNTSENEELIDRLNFKAEKIVFKVDGKEVNLDDFANNKELDINNILADNSNNLSEKVSSDLAKELKSSSSENQLNTAELIYSDLISDELLDEDLNANSESKLNSLVKAMLIDNEKVDSVAADLENQMTGQESFSDLITNISDNFSGSEAIDSGSQTVFGLDESVMEQLVTEMEQFKQLGTNQLEMELEPSWLGKLRLNVSVEQGEVMARFLVDNNFIRHELENNLGLLRGSLARQGFNIEQITIETRDQQAGWQEGDNQHFADDFHEQEYNQEDSSFKFDQEELAYYAKKAGELEGVEPDKIDPRMRKWLSMKQYYNSMNLLA